MNTAAGTDTHGRYLYDGNNLVAEFNAPGGAGIGALVRSYTWDHHPEAGQKEPSKKGQVLTINIAAQGRTLAYKPSRGIGLDNL